MMVGSVSHYLNSLEPGMKKVVGVTLLRLLAGQRSTNVENGEALKVLAFLERDVLLAMGPLVPETKTVWMESLPGK
jgi:hypothetical protein